MREYGTEYRKTLEFDLVNWCTLRCVGCNPKNKRNSKELDFKVIKNKVDTIILCGDAGEPLLHSKITHIIIESAKMANEVFVNTNCEVIDNLTLNKLKLNNVIYEISVDGPTTKIHQYTRRGGDLDRVLNNAEILMNNGLNIQFISTRHKLNEMYSRQIYDMIKQRFDKDILFRDTNEIGGIIEPPVVLSNNSESSVFYKEPKFNDNRKAAKIFYQIEPIEHYRYIRNDGEKFPCFAFADIEKPDVEYKDMCAWYRANGDIRTCIFNCGKKQNGKFRYDTIDEI